MRRNFFLPNISMHNLGVDDSSQFTHTLNETPPAKPLKKVLSNVIDITMNNASVVDNVLAVSD